MGAAGHAFLHTWGDLRRVGERFAGDLAVSVRPLEETLVQKRYIREFLNHVRYVHRKRQTVVRACG